ncbi:MAG: Glu/Leu/Phe/Val dehydrogenase [Actinobacteria bacterium]|nr:MAG: Glu/Leu/Phe/Val dehydrogenase [Actinomycetota bacterium]
MFDLDDCPMNAGGTRLAPDVTEREGALLARAMTYKFAVLHAEVGGAKGCVRGGPEEHDDLMLRYCDEIRPLVESARFLTGPDMGTSEADFAPLRPPAARDAVVTAIVDGVPFEDLLTGFGVAVAAEATVGSLDGRTVALEGFGKVGGGVAREVVRRGGRVVAVSTVHGCVVDPAGLDVELLWGLRAEHGDRFLDHLGRDVRPAEQLFDVEADVLVPGARTGVIDRARAESLAVRAVVPAANVPYAAGAPELLQARGIRAQADFVANAGAVIGYRSPVGSTPAQVLANVERRVVALVDEAFIDPRGPFAGACAAAARFFSTWREDPIPPPPLA